MSEVLPAHAGMIPSTRPGRRRPASAPRACGDDPATTYVGVFEILCSPRMRG